MISQDPPRPSAELLIAIAQGLIHAENYLSSSGRPHDRHALEAILEQPQMQIWLQQMAALKWHPMPERIADQAVPAASRAPRSARGR